MARYEEWTDEHSQEFGTDAVVKMPELYERPKVTSRVNSVEL